ncbi:hypothetical protein ABIF52_003817 [Bradyrhizobium japonicum]|uniref:hypothetical protein n=1 Tax=Bradyrhizobium diazoefficiens TaxID=1355477 RepID=UPI00348C1AB8
MTRSEHSNLYRAPQFRRSVSDALACDRNDVGAAIDRLLGAGRMPMVQAGLPAEIAVWADAARMIAALAGQQILHAAVVNTTDRICAMPRKLFAGGEAPAADRPFGAELASLFRHRHSIAAGPTGFPAVAVAWSQGGLALYAKFDFSERGGPKQRYHSVLPAIAGSVPRPWTAGRKQAAVGFRRPPRLRRRHGGDRARTPRRRRRRSARREPVIP